MKLFNRFRKPLTFVTVRIDNKCYDLPKHLPIPMQGDGIRIDDYGFVTVSHVQYNIMLDKNGRNIMNDIVVITEKD